MDLVDANTTHPNIVEADTDFQQILSGWWILDGKWNTKTAECTLQGAHPPFHRLSERKELAVEGENMSEFAGISWQM